MNGNGRPHGENRGRNGHVLVWEQPGLEEEESPARMRKTLVGSRHIVTLMLFFGMANAYVMRTNMSVAIVAMVNHTSITESKEPVVNECGHDGNASNDSSTLAGPIVPCTHAMLAKWIPPNERSRMGAFVYAGAQFGTVISMPLSGVLSRHGFDGGWPSIFYVFGAVGTIWCIAFLLMIYEDPESHPRIAEDEKKYILSALWGNAGASSPPVPWFSIVTSLPFWAILIAHMGQNYGYETLMTELPTFMKQILNFDIESNGTVSALPYLAMWIFSMLISHVADWMISSGRFNHTFTRKIVNSIGQFGPAIALAAASYTGCNSWLTVTILTIGVGLNGGIYSGFKVNHLDISPRFAGILMSFTNCLANLAGLLAPITAGYIIVGPPTHAKWRLVFMISAGVYIACATFYVIFGSGQRQPWDNPDKDEERQQHEKQDLRCVKTVSETQH
ncbi:putative inorganic phosphate cotransporter isoform X4 [Apis mellifera]|uniref:Inorganic phosphate cotransporter isoform X4 n=1 Tax=Apis mellifera TaxID=7460 RepID=A0A7M7MQY5_APIME|nr:putative inorganic phosphate cotransporter isoform X4 [Apis mellifera]|eukprot:XP_026299705.1 putative inorganic phosphate cotransporter isoform X4 [Apis mellifera]